MGRATGTAHTDDTADDTAHVSPLDKQVAKQDKLRSRLVAEGSVGVSAALVGGFALSLITEGAGMESGSALQWVFVVSMALSGALCLATVLTSGTIYWAGMHLLSAQMKTVRAENDLFREFWKTPALCRARTFSRRAFHLAFPVFLAGITALVYSNTSSVPITAVVGTLFAIMLVFVCVLSMGIEIYVRTNTATS